MLVTSTDSASQIGRSMRILLYIVMLTSYSFIPAESAKLGLVDKSRFSNAVNGDALTHDQFLLAFKLVNRSPRSS